MTNLKESSIVNKGSIAGVGLGGASAIGVYLYKRRNLMKELEQCADEPCRAAIMHALVDLRADAIKVGVAVGLPAAIAGAALSNRKAHNMLPVAKDVTVGIADAAVPKLTDETGPSGLKIAGGVTGAGLLAAAGGKLALDYNELAKENKYARQLPAGSIGPTIEKTAKIPTLKAVAKKQWGDTEGAAKWLLKLMRRGK